ncbi:uncharacterized protein LOC119382472 isoform X2 [Rhipicephalus sanguineus]|uniref:uncharacterized protein LOC119382472 isoform X2 n=1 Tax=Rhipicephalus sanguineus TaxID=34632 RepID=UPI0020C375F9|nr:uncharacterized protein LOC119382472 isoform X2 [Rhipicephalus sanguineus]
MAILKSCCCWKTLRSGSVACGVYTLLLYSIIMVAGSFHVHTVIEHPVLLTFSLLMVLLSAACAVSSVVLLLGLWADNRTLLLPWLVSISLTTLLDVVVLFYLTAESDFNPFIAVLFITDVFIAVLNVYCLLCVSSLYQEYRHNRGRTVRFLGEFPDNMKRSACRKHADAEGKFSPTKPSVFIADDMVSSSITKLSTSTTRRSSALSSCRLTPIKEESQARSNAPGDTLHQSLGATGSGENLSHVYLVSPRPSPIEKEDDDDDDDEEAEEDAQQDAVERQQRGPLPVAEVVSESVYKWTI